MPDLLARVDREYERRKEETRIRQESQKEKLIAAFKEEKETSKAIGKAWKIIEKMETDFFDLEIEAESKARKRITKDIARESDVRAGKISLKKFHQEGKWDAEIEETIIKETTEELDASRTAIRNKALEVMELEKTLYESRQTIHHLGIYPGIIMTELLKGLQEFSQEQVNLFRDDVPGYEIQLSEIKRKLLLTQNKSIGGGQIFDGCTVREARKLQFDPIIPQNLIPKLLNELSKYPDDELVVVSYLFREKDIDVESRRIRKKFLTTSKVIRKVLSTSTFTLDGEEKNG